MTPLRVVVLGAGHMGRLHARKLADRGAGDPVVALAGVFDVHTDRTAALAHELGARAFASQEEAFANADAAIVAVPTVDHFAVVAAALERGLDVLVEKPIAVSLEDAEALLSIAARRARLLQVGHLERFNAALQRVATLARRPRFVEAHRLGPFPARATDVDVVRDLMIHDIDIIQHLLGEEPERIEAIGVPVLTNKVDIANARLTFPGGCVANLTASRVSPTPMRKLRFFQLDGYFSIDFLEQTVVIFRRIQDPTGAAPRIEMEKLEIDREDAIVAEHDAFLRAVRTREAPAVSGDEALRALRTALRVVAAMPDPDTFR
jgi:predicted dehydrogenase